MLCARLQVGGGFYAYVHTTGKQCLCIYKRPKSPISAEAEVGDSFAC